MLAVRSLVAMGSAGCLALVACVPSGSAGPASIQDAGSAFPGARRAPLTSPVSTSQPAAEPMKLPFADDFEHSGVPSAAFAQAEGAAGAGWLEPSSEWVSTVPGIWRIENGRLCGDHAHNHGIWLKRVLPVNARIEFDATSTSPDGDLKAEVWGDGRSYATALSYTNATSYLTIFGG